MIVGALRCNIRVVLARHKRVKIIDRTSGANRFCVRQLFAVLIHDRQVTSLAVLNVTFFPWPGWIVNV